MKMLHFMFLVLLAVIALSACGSMKMPIPSSLIKAQVAEQVKVADTVKAADTIKVADKVADDMNASAEIQTPVGVGNVARKTSVGGNQSNFNDSEIIQNYIDAGKAKDRQINILFWLIIGGGIVLLIINYIIMFVVITKLMKATEYDDEFIKKIKTTEYNDEFIKKLIDRIGGINGKS